MGVHKRIRHIRKDNLSVQDWISKDLVDPSSTVRDLMEDAGQSLPFWPSVLQLQNDDSEDHEMSFLGLKTLILQFTSLHVAVFLLTKQAGNVNIPELDEMFYYRNSCQEMLGMNSVMLTESFQVPTLKC